MIFRVLIFLGFTLLFEFYFLQALKTAVQDFSPNRKAWVLYIGYGVAALTIGLGLLSAFYPPPNWNTALRFIFSILFIILVCKIFAFVPLVLEDLVRGVRWIVMKIRVRTSSGEIVAHGISHAKFLSQAAVALAVIPAIGFIYGIVRGAYKYRVHKVKVPSKNIPDEFDGFKIVQLSDIHVGSFLSADPITKAFDIVMQQNADMILFTGDLVNNVAAETHGYEEQFSRLKAPHGVYSVLGNHDYGDYVEWESADAKVKNLNDLKEKHASFGWKLMMNEHVAIEKNGAKIGLLGIENWGGSLRFPRYGKMNEAHKGTEEFPFKILMSHDPSHWDKQVLTEYKDVDLTVSGHTHGMQLGIEIPGLIQWSPVKYIYKNWAGLYKQDNQFLYVNRGLGFLGYPGRLGIWPEITVIELKKV